MSEYERGQTLLQHLVEIHDHYRSLLKALQSAVDPASPESELPDMRVPLGDLRTHCLYFCRSLTTHHTIEDRHWFPALRRDPALHPVIDRLEAEHHKVAEYLVRIEQVAGTLSESNGEGLAELRTELSRLATDLLAHLSYEEESLAEALSVPIEPR